MATTGPKIRFTPEEKTEFNPHFVSFLQNKATLASIKSALGDNEKKFARFTLYKDALCELIKLKKDKKDQADLTKTAALVQTYEHERAKLTQSIMHRKALITESRDKALETVTSNALRI